jgi:hypothetical protein
MTSDRDLLAVNLEGGFAMTLFPMRMISTALVAGFWRSSRLPGDGAQFSPASGKTPEQICKETKGRSGQESQKCVNAQEGFLDDDSIYETGRHLMIVRYDEAINILNFVQIRKTAGAQLSWLFLPQVRSIDVGLKYYNQALSVDPNYVLARIPWRALIQKGDVAGAKAQLVEINCCGVTCGLTSISRKN